MSEKVKIFGIEISVKGEKEPLKMVLSGESKQSVLEMVTRRCNHCKYLKDKVKTISLCELSNYSCHVELIGVDYDIIYYGYGIYVEPIKMTCELLLRENINLYQEIYDFDLSHISVPFYMFSFVKDRDEGEEEEGHLIFTFDVTKKQFVHPEIKQFCNCLYRQSPTGIKSPCNPLYSAMSFICTYDESYESKLSKIQRIKNKLNSFLYFKWR